MAPRQERNERPPADPEASHLTVNPRVTGLSLHTLVDGFALGAANTDPSLGLLVFLAILAHKVPSSFSLSAILRAEGYPRGRALLMNASYALMVPAGAGVYLLLRELVQAERFTALALAASSGTFLHLALSDILPDLHRRGGSKWKLSLSLLAGVAVMWALRLAHHPPAKRAFSSASFGSPLLELRRTICALHSLDRHVG